MKTPDALHMTSVCLAKMATAAHCAHGAAHRQHQMLNRHRTMLKPHGVTPEQFNILRILKVAKRQAHRPSRHQWAHDRPQQQHVSPRRQTDILKHLVQRNLVPTDRRRVDILLTRRVQQLTEA